MEESTLDLLNLAKQVEPYIVNIRRDLHKHPEISGEEDRTIKVITDELKKLNIEFEIIPNGGVLGFIKGTHPGKTLILRGDIDALPMNENKMNLKEEKLVVSSYAGAAHTCGHDGHTAMLLGAAKILAEHQGNLKGNIILAFEQGEENGRGIANLTERLLEIGADGVWGIHLLSEIPSGKISVEAGPRMASIFIFDVKIKGKGGHGSRPDLARSPIDCFTDFYQQLVSMRLNRLNPFQTITYSIGSIHAGSAANVVPDELQFNGTCRYLEYEEGVRAAVEFHRILEKTCELHDCEFEYVTKPNALDLVVYNEEECATIATEAVKKSLGADALYSYPAWMASETFSFYQKYFPGVFAFLGIKNEAKGTGADHHNPQFDLDEDVLKLGVASTVQYAIDFLNNEKEIDFTPEKRNVKDIAREAGFIFD